MSIYNYILVSAPIKGGLYSRGAGVWIFFLNTINGDLIARGDNLGDKLENLYRKMKFKIAHFFGHSPVINFLSLKLKFAKIEKPDGHGPDKVRSMRKSSYIVLKYLTVKIKFSKTNSKSNPSRYYQSYYTGYFQ